MERITKRIGEKYACYAICEKECPDGIYADNAACMCTASKMAMKRLLEYEDTGLMPEQIVEQTNAGWIPVEERLPEEYGEYLVTIVPSAGYLWAKRIIANFSDLMGIVKKPIFYTGEVGKIDFEDITDMVIAWRPLPEPYRPERSNNHDREGSNIKN